MDTEEDGSIYMQKLKCQGRTTSLHYKYHKLQILNKKVSKKFFNDLGMTVEEYLEQEQEQLKQLKKKKAKLEEVPQKKKDDEADGDKNKNKKVIFSVDTKEKSTHYVRNPRTGSQTKFEAKKTYVSKIKRRTKLG